MPIPVTAVSQSRRLMPNGRGVWAHPLQPSPSRTKSGLVAYNTALWGPALWRALHTAAEVGDLAAAAAVPAALNGALPCPDCEKHYHNWFVTHPVPTDRDGLRRWFLDLHNDVNRRSRKGPWTLAQVTAAYGVLEPAVAALKTLEGMVGSAAIAALRAALVVAPTIVVTDIA